MSKRTADYLAALDAVQHPQPPATTDERFYRVVVLARSCPTCQDGYRAMPNGLCTDPACQFSHPTDY